MIPLYSFAFGAGPEADFPMKYPDLVHPFWGMGKISRHIHQKDFQIS
jgi:hypothetical protein